MQRDGSYLKISMVEILKNKYVWFGLALLSFILTIRVLVVKNSKLNEEVNRLENNQSALLQDVERFTTENGDSALRIKQLTLKAEELEDYRKRAFEEINSLNIRLKDAVSYNETLTNNYLEFTTSTIDTVYITGEQIKSFSYSDGYNNVDGLIFDDSINIAISSVDTLIHVLEKMPKRFLWIKYGCKGVRMNVLNKNKKNTINYSEYILLD